VLDLIAEFEEEPKKKRKGTSLLAVMDENCSCPDALLCELHCPVEGEQKELYWGCGEQAS
jgi:hypothetical protein